MKRDQFSAAALRAGGIFLFAAALVAAPASARAQSSTTDGRSSGAVGERYHIELAATIWNPTPTGIVSSEQFQQIGSDIDFVNDLGYSQTRFKNLQIVRPARQEAPLPVRISPARLQRRHDVQAQHRLQRRALSRERAGAVAVQLESDAARLRVRFRLQAARLRRRAVRHALHEVRHHVDVANSVRRRRRGRLHAVHQRARAAAGARHRRSRLRHAGSRAQLRSERLPAAEHRSEVSGELLGLGHPRHGQPDEQRRHPGRLAQITTFLGIEHDEGDVEFKGMWFGGAIRY